MTSPLQSRPSVQVSFGFTAWLAEARGSIALTTYQSGRFLLLGCTPDGSLSWFEREFTRPMGIAVAQNSRSLALVTQFQIHRFNDIVSDVNQGAFDAVFTPHVTWSTGMVDAHDAGFDVDHRPIFVNTLYSCICAVSEERNFTALWSPPFISALEPEDRCHLNGMCVADGLPRYVSAVSCTDTKDGWREHRAAGGVVIDVGTNDIVVDNLSMPHSPRLHADRLWVLNSGAGEFGYVDTVRGRFEPVAFCPGYARGLAFIGRHAIIGLSAPREQGAFAGLDLETKLSSRKIDPFCGLLVVDLDTGSTEWLKIDGVINELYDVAFLENIVNPSLVGFKTDEIMKRISFE